MADKHYFFNRSNSMLINNMARIISHEVNNPLSIISMAAEVLYQDLCQRSEDVKELDKADRTISRIRTQLIRIREIMATLNLLGKGDYSFNQESLSVNEFLRECIDYVSGEIRNNNTSIDFVFSADFHLLTYKILVQQAFLNILRNAIEAVADLKEPKIQIDIEQGPESISFIIANNGPPVEQAALDKLFVPGESTKGDLRGYGLAASKDFLSFCGAKLEYRWDAPWVKFVVTFPLEQISFHQNQNRESC